MIMRTTSNGFQLLVIVKISRQQLFGIAKTRHKRTSGSGQTCFTQDGVYYLSYCTTRWLCCDTRLLWQTVSTTGWIVIMLALPVVQLLLFFSVLLLEIRSRLLPWYCSWRRVLREWHLWFSSLPITHQLLRVFQPNFILIEIILRFGHRAPPSYRIFWILISTRNAWWHQRNQILEWIIGVLINPASEARQWVLMLARAALLINAAHLLLLGHLRHIEYHNYLALIHLWCFDAKIKKKKQF